MGVHRIAGLLLLMSVTPLHADQFLMFVGTYTKGSSKGIYTYRFDSATGKATPLGLAVETPSPSWITLSADHRFLYAANEEGAGAVSAFAVEGDSGKLRLLNTRPSHGNDPCHLAIDHTGKFLYVANYTGGTVAMFSINPDGSLADNPKVETLKGSSVNKQRQQSPHPHSVNVMKDGRLVIPDLGQDKFLIYKADLTPDQPAFVSIKAGTGPRHLALHPKGNVIYVTTEMGSTIFALSHDNMTELQSISTLPKDFTGTSSGAEIMINPNGKYLYASNRGADSIAVFSTDSKGLLKLIETVPTQGKTPRGFRLDPTGKWLIVGNQDSDNMMIFKIGGNGKLTPSGSLITIGAPVAFEFLAVK